MSEKPSSPIRLRAEGAEVFVPDGAAAEHAVTRTTHLGVGAHPDDLEIMACHGVVECFGRSDQWFTGVTMASGRGSPLDAHYEHYSDARMADVRRSEQKKAAVVGEYSAMVLLNHESSAVKDARDPDVAADLDVIFAMARPRVVYTHNLADKHDTHVAVALRVLAALRRMPLPARPGRLIGCEVWRDLDWLCDEDKVVMPVDRHADLADALVGVFVSQNGGGKRYDLAARGRRLAHATFFESHQLDRHQALVWGMDLTALLEDDARDPFDFVKAHVDRFADDVRARIARLG